MCDIIVNLVSDCLTDRKQSLTVEGGKSSWTTLHNGVPQASVLGPLLFRIYINDLDDKVGSNIRKLSEDTEIYRKLQ